MDINNMLFDDVAVAASVTEPLEDKTVKLIELNVVVDDAVIVVSGVLVSRVMMKKTLFPLSWWDPRQFVEPDFE